MRVEGWEISMHYYLHLLQIMVCIYGIGQVSLEYREDRFSVAPTIFTLSLNCYSLLAQARTALMRMKLYRWCRQIFCLLVSVQM